MHKIFFTIMLACCCLFNTHAQDKRFEYVDSSLLNETQPTGTHENPDIDENALVEEKDILSDTTIYISNIKISPDSVTAWKHDKRFAYIKNLDSLLKEKQQEEAEAANENRKRKPSRFLQKLFSSGIIQLFFWAIAIAFVLFILYKLFLSNGIFRRNAAKTTVVSEVPAEELVKTVADYDKLIHQSIKLGDYRMAVRYLFLKTLVNLSEKEYLQHSADKTNYQYVQEIRADKKNEFASLVLNYEYVWYGNFPLNGELFTGIEKKFSTFNSKIQ
ncbi:MAG: hypothetical protein ABI741_13140 [Ferruginibacter sp.]